MDYLLEPTNDEYIIGVCHSRWYHSTGNRSFFICGVVLDKVSKLINMEQNLSESKILDMLQQHDCEVTFKKVDGELRVMPCTLRPEALPTKQIVEGTRTKSPAPGVLSVWCLDRREWRSFRINNVISVIPIDHVTE